MTMTEGYTRGKLRGYKPTYLYNMICEMDEQFGSAVASSCDASDYYHNHMVTNLARLSDSDLEKVRSRTDLGYVIGKYQGSKFKKGRPMGAKNRPKYTPSAEDVASEIFGDDTAPIIEHEPLPALEAPQKPITDNEALSQLEDLITSILKPIKEENDKEHTYIRGDIKALWRDHDVIKAEFQRHENTFNDFGIAYAKDIADVNDRISKIVDLRPTLIEIKRPDLPEILDLGTQHKTFPMLLNMSNARNDDGSRLNIWVYGSAGTGKSYAARMVAKALGLDFYVTGALDGKHEVLGFNNAHSYVTTAFRKAWEFGGVYCLDETDASFPKAMLALNGGLANSVCEFPDREKPVARHPDCVIICTANTLGTGATQEYSGRFKQDAASMDRFVPLYWPIDEGLERSFCSNQAWVDRVQQVRKLVAQHKISSVMITPRATTKGAALLAAGIPQDQVEIMVLRGAMNDAQWNMITRGY